MEKYIDKSALSTKQYIDKATLLTEINKRINNYTLLQQKPEMSDLKEVFWNKIDCLNSIKYYILNTIKVKEVDLCNKEENGNIKK